MFSYSSVCLVSMRSSCRKCGVVQAIIGATESRGRVRPSHHASRSASDTATAAAAAALFDAIAGLTMWIARAGRGAGGRRARPPRVNRVTSAESVSTAIGVIAAFTVQAARARTDSEPGHIKIQNDSIHAV